MRICGCGFKKHISDVIFYLVWYLYKSQAKGENEIRNNEIWKGRWEITNSINVLFNFYAKDIDEAYQFIKSNNIAIVKEIERIGNFAYFNFQDPDGNVLMICNG